MTPLSAVSSQQTNLIGKLRSRKAQIGIVGLGYVGLRYRLPMPKLATGFWGWTLTKIKPIASIKARATSNTLMSSA